MHNDMEKLNSIIEDTRENIYDYNLKAMFCNIDSLILEMSNSIKLEEIPKDKINIFNNILENINISIRNKDYQLLSDILQFQLKKFVGNI